MSEVVVALLGLWAAGAVGLIVGLWRAARPPRPHVARVQVSVDEHADQAIAVVTEPPPRYRCLVCSPPVPVDDPRTHSLLHHHPARVLGPEDDPARMAVIAERAARHRRGRWTP